MNLDLTISGLCVIVFRTRSQEARPAHPEAVEVLCIDAHHHRPRLSYRPEEAITSPGLRPSLSIDPRGRRFASLDVGNEVMTLDVGANSRARFSVHWGTETATIPSSPEEEAWMNWVPSVQDLGVRGVRRGLSGQLPQGAGARLILPPGDIEARNVIRNPDNRDEFLQWSFPAVRGRGLQRALANEVVFHGVDIELIDFHWRGNSLFAQRGGTLEMGISNDLDTVIPGAEIGRESQSLEHLAHLRDLADPPDEVVVPELADRLQRTGRPICNQAFFVDSGTT